MNSNQMQGRHTTQGHKGIPDGCFEEEQGRKGFFGPVSHLIKPKPSTRWTSIEGPLKPHMFDCVKLHSPSDEWMPMLFNRDVCLSFAKKDASKNPVRKAFRNADADTLYFVHRGNGVIFTEFGVLKYRQGHYLHIPKCATHAFFCETTSEFLVIESFTGAYREPDRGMVGRNAFYDSAAIRPPNLEELFATRNLREVQEIEVKREGRFTKFVYDADVFDTVGWKGDFYPSSLHIDDLMPMLSARVHLPPSAHTTFVANQFVVCTFLPRPLESDADALKVPFYHQNIDYDEVLFYHDGDFFSRDNLHSGMLSFHPAGFPHGPHPKAVQKVKTQTHTNEVAIMIDTWNNLQIAEPFLEVENKDYWKSWMVK